MEESRPAQVRAIIDALRRLATHYGLWYAGAVQQFGLEAALAMEEEAGDRATTLMVDRLCKTLGAGQDEHGLPQALSGLDGAELAKLLEAVAVSWLAVDGVWFQAVEGRAGMVAAKQVNDGCWAQFSPLEAARIQALLRAGAEAAGDNPAPSLEVLAQAFPHRLYGVINEQKIYFEPDGALVLEMTKCRVQHARARKGLPDYPCKSGGVVEYTSFAATVDPHIQCECIACPPDPHPAEYACAWRFRLGSAPS